MTASFGQNSDAAVHPSVISRFLSQLTLGQKHLASSTSVKPEQGAANEAGATASDVATASIRRRLFMGSPLLDGVLDGHQQLAAPAADGLTGDLPDVDHQAEAVTRSGIGGERQDGNHDVVMVAVAG